MVTFELRSLNFVIPEKNRYAYKLEGFDTLLERGRCPRSATYTNLRQAPSRCRVRATKQRRRLEPRGRVAQDPRYAAILEDALVPRAPHDSADGWGAFALHGGRVRLSHSRSKRHCRNASRSRSWISRRLRWPAGRSARGARRCADDGGYWNQIEDTCASNRGGILRRYRPMPAKRFERGCGRPL